MTNLYVALLLGRAYETETADGKTVRLCDAAAAGVEPRRALLMTFTENAAAELRTRVTQLVLRARHEAEEAGDAALVERVVRVLRSLPAAPICTIHSFCAGFLREHALDAGLPPGFSVLDQPEADERLRELAVEELLARLSRGAPSFDPDFERLCSVIQRVIGGEYGASVTEAAQTLLRQAASRGIDLAAGESLLPPPRLTGGDELAAVAEQLKRVRSERGGELPPTAAEALAILGEFLRRFPTLGKKGGDFSNDWKNEDQELADALRSLKTSFRGGGELAELSRRLKEAVARLRSDLAYRRHVNEIRAFARYAGAVSAAYAARKRQLGVADFDDLLAHTRALLEARPGEFSALFDHIIVDEVQDTSRIQYDIIRRLWSPGANSLVICGDIKQSIYAWRNADPAVMPDLGKEIAGAPAHKSVSLRASYRSKDGVLDLVNRLFARVYGESYTANEQLVPAAKRNARVASKGERPCVEFLKADWETAAPSAAAPDEEETGDEAPGIPAREQRVFLEMKAVVQRIKLLVEGADDWRPRFRFLSSMGRFEPTGESNAYRYSDILILLRRTSNQQILEHLLRQYQVPYRIGGRGKGLFARQEVKDVYLFLRALTHSFDTIALIGFLRSPWIGLSDESLLRLGWNGESFEETAFRDRVLGDERVLDDDTEAARAALARSLLRKYRGEAHYRLPSELVRLLVAETGFDAVIAGTFRGSQRLANLRKLIDWLRSAERGGTVLLADVVRQLEENLETAPEVPEAAVLDPDQNAVTIMTVHGAKGLTARVVFVPELSADPPTGAPWALLAPAGDRTGLEVRIEDLTREPVTSPGYEAAREREKTMRTAEARNVFYVALTRARDLVVLSGARSGRTGGAWRGAVDELLAQDPESRALVRDAGYGAIQAACEAAGLLPAETAGDADVPDAAVFEAAGNLCRPSASGLPVLRYPATILSAFHAQPEQFLLTALPGAEPFWMRRRQAPDAPDAAPADVAPAPAGYDPGSYAVFGTAGHRALEQMAATGWTADPAAIVRAAAEEAGLSPAQAADLQFRIGQAVQHIRSLSPAAGTAEAEWPFALLLGDDAIRVIVDGTIDLLFRGADGSWTIVDYKFTDDGDAHLAARYGLQLNLYAEALRRRFGPAAPVRAVLLAASREGARLVDIPADPAVARRGLEAAVAVHKATREGFN